MSRPTPYLDPLNQALANQLSSQPPLEDLSFEQFRELFATLQQHTPTPGVTRTKFVVPFGHGGVDTFVFRPDGVRGTLPVILYLHGGGWVAGT
jgi:acetyl esterase